MAKQTTAPEAAQPSDNSAELQQQLVALEQELTSVKEELATTTNQLESHKEHASIIGEANQKLSAELEEKTSELEQASNLIEELTGKLAAAEVSQAEGPVIVTHEKEQYRVLAPKFQHHGLDVDAHTLRQNPDLVRELVEGGSGLLQKVVAKQEPAK